MKKLLLALSILAIAFAGTASAQNVFVDDAVGIYTDGGEAHAMIAPFAQTTLHVVLTGMTAPSVAAFEFTMTPDGPMIMLEPVFPTDAINAATRPNEFSVGYGAPLPNVDGTVELMSFDVILTSDAQPASISLAPVYFSSLPGVPSYLVSADSGELVEMRVSTGSHDLPVFVANGEAPVATESTSLDAFKSLYR